MNRMTDFLKAYQLIVAALILALGGIVTASIATRNRYVPLPLPMAGGCTDFVVIDQRTGEAFRHDGTSLKK